MTPGDDRRAELLGAALGGDLSDAEQRELELLRQADPHLDAELAALGSLASTLAQTRHTGRSDAPPADLGARVSAMVEAAAAETGSDRGPIGGGTPAGRDDELAARRRARGGRVYLGRAAAAVVLVAAGAIGALAAQQWTQAPPDGPPGTLGAVEPIAFTGQPEQSEITAHVVAHTWGTETLLEIDGLREGESFDVTLVDLEGNTISSGSFIGTAVTVECAVNAAILREEVAQIRITSVDGSVAAAAELPRVG
ncbi:hypothetical protein CEY15_11335 [Dietzia natronolimnaea]|uniref:Anti-sigma factor n=1 Tax=Dietzia natronolimnaea TaxID=161920 RepID=A0A2A2WNZ2_9ACTN|nr:hypothetical protein [Dietzia natronolimnaea]PAY22912.1 hypothetical protein CEY15_11335 [Dietzia natronolimnaea]